MLESAIGFRLENTEDVRGATMVDKEAARIGKIEDVFLDRHTLERTMWEHHCGDG